MGVFVRFGVLANVVITALIVWKVLT